MISSARQYNENYYTNRKKILQDFLKDEETETMKYIDETETLVSNTKMILSRILFVDVVAKYYTVYNKELSGILGMLRS